MNSNESKKIIVKNKYAQIVMEKEKTNCCCGSDKKQEYSVFNDSYKDIKGYFPEADLGLGCGLPTEYIQIKEGEHILDLGSGAGNDVFIAAKLTGPNGYVTGLDFTDEMIRKAESNRKKLDIENVDFKKGDIENMPLENETYDVVISNCVLNLVPDKHRAFKEIKRVLKETGRFCVSDIVINGELSGKMRETAALYAGCVSGALSKNKYMAIIRENGFQDIQIRKEREIILPDELIKDHLTEAEILEFRNSKTGIFSITVTATK